MSPGAEIFRNTAGPILVTLAGLALVGYAFFRPMRKNMSDAINGSLAGAGAGAGADAVNGTRNVQGGQASTAVTAAAAGAQTIAAAPPAQPSFVAPVLPPAAAPAQPVTPQVAAPVDSPAPVDTLSVRARVASISEVELGRNVTETSLNDDMPAGNIIKYRTAVLPYDADGKPVGEDPAEPQAWCADFASWVWREAGIPLGEPSHIDGLGRGEDLVEAVGFWAQRQGRWHQPAEGYQPQTGDLIIFNWYDGGTEYDHIAVVVGVSGSSVRTIGGNQKRPDGSWGVTEKTYDASASMILGYVTPP